MLIDAEATRDRFTKSGRTVAAWARIKGFSPSTVNEIVNGTYPLTGTVATKIVAELEADALVVYAAEEGVE